MILKAFLVAMAAAVTFGFSSCAVEKKRVPVPAPGSDESDLPWNMMQPGEGQGQFGAFSR